MNTRDPGRLPNNEQTLMLRAALLPGPEGRDAALRWLPTANIDRLGKSSRRLMPLLYERLREDGVEHPILPVLKGVKRHTWYNNRILFHQAREAVQLLKDAGIDVMLIKGAALTIAYYRDYGLRPMEDLDLMVPVESAAEALTLMQDNGWVSEWPGSTQFLQDRVIDYRHALHFRNPSGRDIDLHWHLLAFNLRRELDQDYWQASHGAEFEGHSIRILSPEDHLLHTVVHGGSWDLISPIRWIPDAIAIIRATPDLEWDRLIFQSRKRELSALVRASFEYLQSEFGSPVPCNVMAQLENTRVSILQRLEYESCVTPASRLRKPFLFYLSRCWRSSQGLSIRRKLEAIPLAVCASASLGRRRQIPVWACRKLWKRLLAAISRSNRLTQVNSHYPATSKN